MATTLTITSPTYAGEAAKGYLAAALLEGNTIAKGGIEVRQNIRFKQVMQKIGFDANVIKDATCGFSDTSTVTLTERVLQPEEFQSNLEFCKKDFVPTWEAMELGMSAHKNIPKSFSDFVLGHVAGLIAEKTETNIWEGVNSNAGEFDGFVPLALADSDVIDVASHAAVTSSNVIAKLGSIVDAIPAKLYTKDDMYIYVSQNIARAYVRALGGFAAQGEGGAGLDNKGTMWYTPQGPLAFDGVKLFVANGLNDDTAMATQKSNLFYGCGLLNDANEAKVIDMSPIDGSQNFRVVMRYTSGVQYAIGSEIVLYHA
jgi:hypothetical protein